MSRGAWSKIKQSKFFYVYTYRKVLTFIIASAIMNTVLCVAISYSYFHRPERAFYSTSGVVAPVKLTPMDTPNYSAEAKLPPDPVNEDDNKVIPE